MTCINNRKGIFYTFSIIVILGILLIILFSYYGFKMRDAQESTESRVRTMNDFLNDFHNDMHRAVRISATRAMISLEEHLTTTGLYYKNLTDIEDHFKEVFYNGTYDGDIVGLMEASTFKDYEQKVMDNAETIGLSLYVNVTSIKLAQYDPWNLLVDINATVKLNDSSKLAYWEYNRTFSTLIPIEGLRDPLYSIETYGKLQLTIQRGNTTFLVNGTDTSGLVESINNSYYIPSPDAPSLLMRFYHNLSNDPHGIESIVDIGLLSQQEIAFNPDANVIDYKYFQDVAADQCNFQNMPAWFKINNEDRINLGLISPLNYTGC